MREVYDTLCENPFLSTVVRGDDTVVYFDNYDDVIKAYNLMQEEEVATKGVMIYKAKIELYDNTNYKKNIGTYETLSRQAVPALAQQKKLSSFKLTHNQRIEGMISPILIPQESYVTFYDKTSYTGKNITFINPAMINHGETPGFPGTEFTSTLSIPKLKNHGFNDAACSMIFGFRIVP
ncbi:MAG: hypothetical protein LUH10_18450 [Tannerellaceae bacterium]|nr:hypothetical protein [Tannerellaceae bacterium]